MNIAAEISKHNPKAGDIVLVKLDEELQPDQIRNLLEHLHAALQPDERDYRVIIVGPDIAMDFYDLDDLVRRVGEALEDAALLHLGRDLGTVHRDDIARAAIKATLGIE